jgi:hypothetical protein
VVLANTLGSKRRALNQSLTQSTRASERTWKQSRVELPAFDYPPLRWQEAVADLAACLNIVSVPGRRNGSDRLD